MTMLTTATPLFSTRRTRPRTAEDPAAGPGGSGGQAIEASSMSLGFQLGDVLSQEPVQFLDRQRQPYGE